MADWLDLMAPNSELQLLLGMAPHNWKFLAKSAEAHAAYVLRAMQVRASDLDRALLKRLVDHQQAGRLRIRLRDPRHPVHAKLYLIQTASHAWKGLAGSSNLSESGLTQPGEFNLVLDAAAAAQASRWMGRQWGAPLATGRRRVAGTAEHDHAGP